MVSSFTMSNVPGLVFRYDSSDVDRMASFKEIEVI